MPALNGAVVGLGADTGSYARESADAAAPSAATSAASRYPALLRSAPLVPVDDSMNLHKQQQLKELAILNGTYKGDRQGDDRLDRWKQIRKEHDKYKAKALPAEAMAAYGRQLGNGAPANPALDQEYKAFMSEIGGGPSAGAAPGGAPAQPPPGGVPMQMPQMQMDGMRGMPFPMGGMPMGGVALR